MAKENFIVHAGKSVVPDTDSLSLLAPKGLVSILVPCCGQLEYTKLLVPGLLRYTRPPFEVIFLDIGSLDGTAEYLAGVQADRNVRIEVVHTATDQGIKDAVKQALAQARGEYLVLLNNDTLVIDAWLNQLIALAEMSPAIGLVGPMSNYAAPPQFVETVPYRTEPWKRARPLSSLEKGGAHHPLSLRERGWGEGETLVDVAAVEAFANEFRDKHRGNWVEAERLGGFCLFMKRAVLKKIEQHESLDRWSDLSLFDTDILSSKARQYGFTLRASAHFG